MKTHVCLKIPLHLQVFMVILHILHPTFYIRSESILPYVLVWHQKQINSESYIIMLAHCSEILFTNNQTENMLNSNNCFNRKHAHNIYLNNCTLRQLLMWLLLYLNSKPVCSSKRSVYSQRIYLNNRLLKQQFSQLFTWEGICLFKQK